MPGMKRGRRGGVVLEFTLVGIPLMFVLISTFEMARGMWIYHTLAFAVREGTRYTAFHGYNCATLGTGCSKQIADAAGAIQYAGVGLLPDQLTLTFTANAGGASPVTVTCPLLKDCLTNATAWPPAGANSPGMDVSITASYPFSSAIAMFWPGAGGGTVFPTYTFSATSREGIQF